jgi:hypothetical protein
VSSRVALFLAAVGFLPGGRSQTVVPPRFEDYRVGDVYRGAVKPPEFGDLSRYEGTDLRCFGGDPAAAALEHVNFAGHFVIDACTCGTGCHYLYMWDAVTGKFFGRLPPGVIDIGPYDLGRKDSVEYKGEEHRADSSLLIVDGCVEDTCDCATRYYRWTGNQFQLVLRRPVRMPSACAKKR